MAVKTDGPRAPYHEIAADLREQIKSGSLAPGTRLESLRGLARRYSVAGNTVQSALRVLRSEGLVETIQGRGTFVAPIPDEDLSESAIAGLEAELRAAKGEIAVLREDVERLQVQMMVVYDHIPGIAYPHERATGREVG
jgi:DNA-binding GntR family transcriptional regulator